MNEVKTEILLLVATKTHEILLVEGDLLSLPRAFLNKIQTCKGIAVALLNSYTGVTARFNGEPGWVDVNYLGLFDDPKRTGGNIRTLGIAFYCMLPEPIHLLVSTCKWYKLSDVVKIPLADDHLRIISSV